MSHPFKDIHTSAQSIKKSEIKSLKCIHLNKMLKRLCHFSLAQLDRIKSADHCTKLLNSAKFSHIVSKLYNIFHNI